MGLAGCRALGQLFVAALVAGCQAAPPPAADAPSGAAARFDPSRDLGALFHEVQVARVFEDSKTFVDATPKRSPADLLTAFATARSRDGFDLAAFVREHFEVPAISATTFHADSTLRMEDHIRSLWPALTRTADSGAAGSSLIPLPNAYVVPGGRFREVYYWDSYFTMLGLVEGGRTDLVKSMLENFAHLIRTVGFIPNGNRTYYLGRSQPPFFAAMVGLYAAATDTTGALPFLAALEQEHAFWQDGADRIGPGEAHRRVVRLPNGDRLNRYWDDRPEPRPESYREDAAIGATLPDSARIEFYRNARATAESGWDFSSRWLRDPHDLRTLETIGLAPVDLNSLLFHAERTIAALRRFRRASGDQEVADRFAADAETRRRAVLAASYDSASGYFYDVRWRTGERVTDRPTLAAAAPLYFGLATPEQARAVARKLERAFLKAGGYLTTLIRTGQQWDAPNGWPPLQWLTIQGLCRYGQSRPARFGRERWLALNRRVFARTGKMTEKYDVADLSREAGGGEYPNQDGFGWTNGVALALSSQERVGARSAASPLACQASH
jgi:alpha,alpha-trehalase